MIFTFFMQTQYITNRIGTRTLKVRYSKLIHNTIFSIRSFQILKSELLISRYCRIEVFTFCKPIIYILSVIAFHFYSEVEHK